MKYKIFVSGNQKELKDERFAVKEVVNNSASLRNFFDVFLFEDLPAKGKSPVAAYLKQVDNSDIYICIIGKEYGIKGKDGLSATEREFRRFTDKKQAREIFAFIQGENKRDPERDKDTQDFFKTIKDSFIYKRFTSIDNLKTQVLNSLISYLDDKGEINRAPFDKTLCRECDYKAIDEKAVVDFLQNRAVKLKVAMPDMSIKDFLVNTLKVVKKEKDGFCPTNTALLFFGKDPAEFISQSEIRIARFKGTTRSETIDSRDIKGPIYKMLDEVKAFFLRNTRLANKIVEFKRVDIPEYPYEAIRESVINAIAHRDYTRRGTPIMFSIFDDRIEVSNPGGLLPGLNIKKLEGHHATRNESICNIFHETMDMERFGTGIGKMKKSMKSHGLPAPELEEEGDFFMVRFHGPGDKILDLAPDIPEERQTDLKKLGLNERQIEALRLMINEKQIITNELYQKIFKASRRTAVRDLQGLVKSKQARSEGIGKGTKYRA